MKTLAELGGGAQVLRGMLGFAFPYLLWHIPSDKTYTAPLVVTGVFSYIAARWLVLWEPRTLHDMGGISPVHKGEAVFVSLALIMALVLLHESGVYIGIGAGVILVILYLLAHMLLLPLLVMFRLEKTEHAPERPTLRRFIRGSAFVAGEAVAVMTIALALHGHDEARRGPDWGLWDVTPITPMVLLVIGFTPIVWLEMAATTKHSTKGEERQAAIEAILVQAGAIVVSAFTGQAPWF